MCSYYLPVCLFPLPIHWVAFPHFFGFFWHNFWSSTQTILSSWLSFSASRCSSENMKTSLHQRVCHWLSVSQTSQSITRNILLLNLCLKYPADGRSLLGWLWSINSDLRSCSKTGQKRTFFSYLGDHSHHWLHSFVLMTCFVICHLISMT